MSNADRTTATSAPAPSFFDLLLKRDLLQLDDLEQKARAASQAPLELSDEDTNVTIPNAFLQVGEHVLVRQDGKLPDADSADDAAYILASTPAVILQLIACVRALGETHETMLSAAHTLGLTANADAQTVVRAIHDLQQEAAGLRKDKRLLDSGMIMTNDRDEFGEHTTHRRGIDLRGAIKAAMKEQRLCDEISGDTN